MGAINATAALDRCGRFDPGSANAVLISAGFAGALQPGLATGDIVFDPLEAPVSLAQGARETAEELGVKLHMGKIHSVDRVLTAKGAKRELGESLRAAAVDMETASIATWACERGATPLGIRVILDEVDDPLPEEAPEDASFSAGLRYALSRPTQIPLLIALGIRQKRAMSVLVRFLEVYLKRIPSYIEISNAEEA
jgi:nucleoside phosphorylase